MPNKVIRDIYFDYFLQVMEEKAQTNRDLYELGNALDELIWENRPQPILEVLQVALKSLTNRDFQTSPPISPHWGDIGGSMFKPCFIPI